jgi:hypothetical protein
LRTSAGASRRFRELGLDKTLADTFRVAMLSQPFPTRNWESQSRQQSAEIGGDGHHRLINRMGAPPFRIQDGVSHENMRSKVVPVRYRKIVHTLQDNPRRVNQVGRNLLRLSGRRHTLRYDAPWDSY